jgi:hypothetical protein
MRPAEVMLPIPGWEREWRRYYPAPLNPHAAEGWLQVYDLLFDHLGVDQVRLREHLPLFRAVAKYAVQQDGTLKDIVRARTRLVLWKLAQERKGARA